MRKVHECPCGDVHRLSDTAFRRYRDAVDGKTSDTVPMGNLYSCWLVPRTFAQLHVIDAAHLPVFAAQFGWKTLHPPVRRA